MYRYAVNVNRTKTQLATLKKDKVNYLVGWNFDWKIKTSSGEILIESIVYVNTGSVDLKNDTLISLWGSSYPSPQDPEFTGNCLVDLKPADVDALNSVFVNWVVWWNHQYWFDWDEYPFDHNLSKEEWCWVNWFSSNWVTLANMPRAIWKLYNVYMFDIYNAWFTQIPDTIWYLTNLERINISWNPWLVTLPGSIWNLINLKQVDFSWNGLTDLPNNFTKLVHLEYIYLQDNNLGYDAFWDWDAWTKFDTLTKVHEIDLSNNPQLWNNISQKFLSFGEYSYWTQSYAYDWNNFTITRPGWNLPLQFEWNIRVYD
jgi:Leucine-rich repeat (LRR) protein